MKETRLQGHAPAAQDPLFRRGQGNENHIVLILARGCLPLGLKIADDFERDTFDPDGLAHAVVVAEQLLPHRVADQGDFTGAAQIFRPEGTAIFDDPFTRLQIVPPDAVDRG